MIVRDVVRGCIYCECIPRPPHGPHVIQQSKTRLLGHTRPGDCIGPGSISADTLEDVETGERTPLGHF
jgi:hypothetical protein